MAGFSALGAFLVNTFVIETLNHWLTAIVGSSLVRSGALLR